MNNKGFAITGFIYTIFIIFIVIMVAILNMFNARKNILDKLKNGVQDEVNNKSALSNMQTFEIDGNIAEFKAYKSSFYRVKLKSRSFSADGGIVTFDIYLNKDEILYMKNNAVSTKDNGATEANTDIVISFDKNFASEKIIASASDVPDGVVKNYVVQTMNNRRILNSNIQLFANKGEKNIVEINAITKAKINEDLNRVRYIKDCVHGGDGSYPNSWAELKVYVSGVNIAKGIIPTLSSSVTSSNPAKYMTDDNIHSYTKVSTSDEACAIIDLGKSYNVDSIQIIHEPNQTAYHNKTYVSLDNKDYKVISSLEDKETSDGVIIDAYDDKQVIHVGNVYAPIKKFMNAKWLRVLHHNTLGGTLFWNAKAQVLTEGGYDSIHKQSILYNLEKYKNKSGQYEFLLEYSDIEGYNRWIQTSNPVTTSEDVTGYKEVKTYWTKGNWYGLALSTSSGTVIDGNKGSSWWYAVGAISAHQNGVPAANSTISKGTTSLWVRIDNLK